MKQAKFCKVLRVNMPNGAIIACAAQKEDGGWCLYENLEATTQQIEGAVAELKEQIRKVES